MCVKTYLIFYPIPSYSSSLPLSLMEKNKNKNNDRRKRKMVENNNSSNNNEDDEDVHKQPELQEELQEENDEEKMEQFFALIRNTKDMRDRLKQQQIEKKKQLEEEEEESHHLLQKVSGFNNNNNNNNNVGAQTWNPTFQVEDFMDGIAKSSNSNININISQDATQELLPVSSTKSQEAEVAEAEAAREGGNTNDHLDLNLSL
ncbi:protein NIM1-INTERACTING 3 [Mangifera indica]|uniref:protein NIM1-INTERACTING 3 n=1 Tax=Mangifera indica TaxID=29780 RepID=UPI001CFB5018|nr:protein NIM1-INTERACTING 3 [Mangifera indica]